MKGELVSRAGHKMFLSKRTPRFTEEITEHMLHMLNKFNMKKSFKALPRWIPNMFQNKKKRPNINSPHLQMDSVGRSDLLSIFYFGGRSFGPIFQGLLGNAPVRFFGRVIYLQTDSMASQTDQAANIPRWKVVDGQYVPLKWGDLPRLNSDGRLGKAAFLCGGETCWRNGCETKTEILRHQKPGRWQLKYFRTFHPETWGRWTHFD